MSHAGELRLVSVWRAFGYLAVIVLVVGCLWPRVDTGGPPGIDKLLHFAAFASLAAWFGALTPPARHVRLAVALAGLGLTIELLQWLSGYRGAEVLDWLADVAGVALGLVLARPLVRPCLGYIDARVATGHCKPSEPRL